MSRCYKIFCLKSDKISPKFQVHYIKLDFIFNFSNVKCQERKNKKDNFYFIGLTPRIVKATEFHCFSFSYPKIRISLKVWITFWKNLNSLLSEKILFSLYECAYTAYKGNTDLLIPLLKMIPFLYILDGKMNSMFRYQIKSYINCFQNLRAAVAICYSCPKKVNW